MNANREGRWQNIIDYILIEWGRNPEQFDIDCGPTSELILLTIQLCQWLSGRGCPSPDSLVVDVNGGIDIEFNHDQSIHVWDDHEIEILEFTNGKLDVRRHIVRENDAFRFLE